MTVVIGKSVLHLLQLTNDRLGPRDVVKTPIYMQAVLRRTNRLACFEVPDCPSRHV